MRLEGQTTALCQVTTHGFKSLRRLQCIAFILTLIRNRWTLAEVASQALDTTIEQTGEKVFGGIRNLRERHNFAFFLAEVESLNQITVLLTAPLRNFFGVEWLAMRLGPFLQEHDLTFVCRVLREHMTTLRIRRDNIEGKTVARADRLVAELLVERIRHPLTLDTLRGVRCHDMVGPTACLVVREDKRR